MGLRAHLTRLPEARLGALCTDVSEWAALYRDQERMAEEDHENGRSPFLGGTDALGYADLDKTWDALVFLLDPARRSVDGARDETPDPATASVAGRHPMPEPCPTEFDHLPRYNTAAETAEVAAALAATGFDALLSEYGPALGSSRAYTYGRGRPLADQDVSFIRSRFEDLRAFYAEAARLGQAVLVSLR